MITKYRINKNLTNYELGYQIILNKLVEIGPNQIFHFGGFQKVTKIKKNVTLVIKMGRAK